MKMLMLMMMMIDFGIRKLRVASNCLYTHFDASSEHRDVDIFRRNIKC